MEGKKKEQAESFLSLCTIWIVTGIKFGTYCKEEGKKNYSTLDVKCDLHFVCVLEILKRIPKDLWSWGHNVLMIGFLCTYPQPLRWGPEKLKLTSDIMNTLNDEAAGQGQAASLKQSGCVSGLQVSRQRQGQGNGLFGHKIYTSVLLLSLPFEIVSHAFSNILSSQPDSKACSLKQRSNSSDQVSIWGWHLILTISSR